MPKKKKEEPVALKEVYGNILTSVINFGSVIVEMSFDRNSGKIFGTVFENGKVKKFETEVE